TVLDSSWSQGMTYSSATGMLEAGGEVRAVWTKDELSRDEIEAGHVKLALRPRSDSEASHAPGSEPPSPLIRAEATGSIRERAGQGPRPCRGQTRADLGHRDRRGLRDLRARRRAGAVPPGAPGVGCRPGRVRQGRGHAERRGQSRRAGHDL